MEKLGKRFPTCIPKIDEEVASFLFIVIEFLLETHQTKGSGGFIISALESGSRVVGPRRSRVNVLCSRASAFLHPGPSCRKVG